MARGMQRTHYNQFPRAYIDALEQFNKKGAFEIELPWREAMASRRMFYQLFSLLRDQRSHFATTKDKLTAYYDEIAKNIIIVIDPSKAPDDAPVKMLFKKNPLIKKWKPIPLDLSLNDAEFLISLTTNED